MTQTTEEVRGPAFLQQVEQWGAQEIALSSTRPHLSPFQEMQLRGHFRRGDETVTAEGFHDGGPTWKVRFMPPVQGRWTFETQSNDPELDGQSGAFEVTAPRPDNHGPVGVRGRHFAYADGTPFFPLGTTIYNWLNREDDLQRRTLATLAGSPFNKVRFLIFPKDMPYNRVDPPLYPVAVSGEADGMPTFDFGEFNPEFFARIESRLLDLQALGVEAEVILFHPYDKWGFSRMGREHDEAYLRYVVARLSAFRNVWWMLANEYDLFDPESFLGHRFPERKDWDRLGTLVQQFDPSGHLRAIHNCFGWFDHARPWVSYVAVQEQYQDLTEVTLKAREYGKPVIIEEYGYEGTVPFEWGNLSAGEVVNRHWAITLAGGYGKPTCVRATSSGGEWGANCWGTAPPA